MKVKHLRHIPLFEHFSSDQDEEDVEQVDNLPYFHLILELARKPLQTPSQLNWTELELALTTCAYLGTDQVAKSLVAQALWAKNKSELSPILDFQTIAWKKDYSILNKYLEMDFKLAIDDTGKIEAVTRVQHCWTDREIHDNTILTAEAAAYGNVKTLAFLHEKGAPWNKLTCLAAAQKGHLSCLKYAHENGYPWDEATCHVAAEKGHLHCLKYAHENGCPWDADTCMCAAENGHLHCLKYLHENGCPWDSNTCSQAAESGYLDCLRYARENGCPWDKFTCSWAARNGQLPCLIYAHENGCSWDSCTCLAATYNGHMRCLAYAVNNGCPSEW